MAQQLQPAAKDPGAAFIQEANRRRAGFVPELIDFLRTNKKWWLTPIVIVLLLLGSLIFMSGTSLAPFIYSVF
jgi:hypothetical protein